MPWPRQVVAAIASYAAAATISCVTIPCNRIHLLIINTTTRILVTILLLRGPTHDGRIKPDVCGPGSGVYSAASTVTPLSGNDRDLENCRGVVKYGTSSANAIVGGVTLLVRQYFTKGYYPDGKKKRLGGFKPMGALLKAVLVNSARPLIATGRDHVSNDAVGRQPDLPNDMMGWGGVNIASTLITPSSPRGLQLKVFGKYDSGCEFMCPRVSQDQVKVYKIKVGGLLVLLLDDYPHPSHAKN